MTDRRHPIAGLALAAITFLLAFTGSACTKRSETKQYPLTGQVLGINREKQEITIKHADVPGLMPGMTMSFPVADPALLDGREPGELVTATLEVTDAIAKLKSIVRTGVAPLPEGTNAAAMAGAVLGAGDLVPDAAFIDQADARRSMAQWRGSAMVITFVYARCPLPNFCPLMNQNFAKLQKAIAGDASLRDRVKLVTISFDPEHDTPAVLADEAKHYGADPAIWTFLTGDRATVDRFAAVMGVGLTRTPGTDEIVHNLRTTVVDPGGHIVAIFSGNEWTTTSVMDSVRTALAAKRP
jgi:protein SCO1/2